MTNSFDRQMTGREFIESMYISNYYENGPEPMTEADAAYNLECYRTVDHLYIPPTVTPKIFTFIWNRMYQNDMKKGA